MFIIEMKYTPYYGLMICMRFFFAVIQINSNQNPLFINRFKFAQTFRSRATEIESDVDTARGTCRTLPVSPSRPLYHPHIIFHCIFGAYNCSTTTMRLHFSFVDEITLLILGQPHKMRANADTPLLRKINACI